jgi:predicted aspartyl protease
MDWQVEIPQVLVDAGSASTMLSADLVSRVGIQPEASDPLLTIRGVGGIEVVYTRQVDRLVLGEKSLEKFVIEIEGMNYGFEINGLLGMDYLVGARTRINLDTFEINFA